MCLASTFVTLTVAQVGRAFGRRSPVSVPKKPVIPPLPAAKKKKAIRSLENSSVRQSRMALQWRYNNNNNLYNSAKQPKSGTDDKDNDNKYNTTCRIKNDHNRVHEPNDRFENILNRHPNITCCTRV